MSRDPIPLLKNYATYSLVDTLNGVYGGFITTKQEQGTTTMRVNPTHSPLVLPKGCNGKYGVSAYSKHKREGTEPCERDMVSLRHYRAELRRGQPKPRRLKPCGTWAAAARHRYNNEPLDFACSVAESRYQQKIRDRKKGQDMCEHEDISNQGVCLDCEQPVAGWEPSDAQIFACYGQTKELAA